VEYNKKNSAEDVSDERVDAFSSGLRCLDLIEELGRTNPKTVSELTEIANRFADGEVAYYSKRARSPEYDRSSRQHNQRRRSHNEDGRTMRNQVAVGYERRDGERDENEEYHKNTTIDKIGRNILTHRQRISFTDLVASTTRI
jgi:hypothetical protein